MAKPRAFVGDFSIHCGPITTRGRLLPVKLPKEDGPKMCTPDGRSVQQVYQDDEGTIWYRDQLGRGTLNEDGTFTLVDAEALNEAKQSDLPANVIDLTIHNADEVAGYLWPSDHNAYIFDPIIKNGKKVIDDPVNRKWHDLLNIMVRESGVVFLGKANLPRSTEGLYRLAIYQGHIVIQRMLYPEDLHQYETMNLTVSDDEKRQAIGVVRKLVTPFDPEAYEDEVRRRVAEVAAAEFDPDAIKRSQPRPEDISITKALEAFLSE